MLFNNTAIMKQHADHLPNRVILNSLQNTKRSVEKQLKMDGTERPSLGSQANQQNHFKLPFWKAKRMGAILTSNGRVFYRDGDTAEKALFLDAACQNSLTHGSDA